MKKSKETDAVGENSKKSNISKTKTSVNAKPPSTTSAGAKIKENSNPKSQLSDLQIFNLIDLSKPYFVPNVEQEIERNEINDRKTITRRCIDCNEEKTICNWYRSSDKEGEYRCQPCYDEVDVAETSQKRAAKRESESVKVIQYQMDGITEIKRYDSIAIASKETGVGASNISLVCSNKRGSAGKYKWKYDDPSRSIRNEQQIAENIKRNEITNDGKIGQSSNTNNNMNDNNETEEHTTNHNNNNIVQDVLDDARKCTLCRETTSCCYDEVSAEFLCFSCSNHDDIRTCIKCQETKSSFKDIWFNSPSPFGPSICFDCYDGYTGYHRDEEGYEII